MKCVEQFVDDTVEPNTGRLADAFYDDLPTIQDCVENGGTHIVMTTSEYLEVTSNTLFDPDYLTLEQKQDLFVFSFSLPLVVYLVAWAYQTVINFATDNNY